MEKMSSFFALVSACANREDILLQMEDIIKQKRYQEEGAGSSLVLLDKRKNEYFKQLDEIQEEVGHCRERMDKGKGAHINVEGVTYKGVILSIENTAKQSTGDLRYTTYRSIGGEIVTETFRREAPARK